MSSFAFMLCLISNLAFNLFTPTILNYSPLFSWLFAGYPRCLEYTYSFSLFWKILREDSSHAFDLWGRACISSFFIIYLFIVPPLSECLTSGILSDRHSTFSGCLTSGILSGQHSTFSGCLTSGILSGQPSTFSGCLPSGILSGRPSTFSECLASGILSGRRSAFSRYLTSGAWRRMGEEGDSTSPVRHVRILVL